MRKNALRSDSRHSQSVARANRPRGLVERPSTSERLTEYAPPAVGAGDAPEPQGGDSRVRSHLLTDTVLALLLVGLASYVRWPGLGAGALSFADSWVAIITHLDDPGDIVVVGLTAPGFTFLAKVWFALFGFSTGSAQVPAFILGSLTPGTAYLVARRLPASPIPALAAGLLLALSPVHVSHSVMLKQYTLDAFMVLLLVWLALRIRATGGDEARVRLRVLVGASITATVASASVGPVALSSVVAGAFLLWCQGGRKIAAASFATYVVAAGTWVLILSPRIPTDLTEYWDGRYIESLSDFPRIGQALGAGLGLDGLLPAYVFGVIALLTAVWMARRALAVGILLIGPFIVAFALAAIERVPIGTGRTDIYLYPLLALGVSWLLSHGLGRIWMQVVLVFALVVTALPVPAPHYPADPARPLVETLVNNRRADDQVIANYGTLYSLAVYSPWMDGLIKDIPTVRGFMPRFEDPNVIGIERIDNADAMTTAVRGRTRTERVWVLFNPRSQPWTEDAIATAMRLDGYELISDWDNGSAVLQLWSQTPPSP